MFCVFRGRPSHLAPEDGADPRALVKGPLIQPMIREPGTGDEKPEKDEGGDRRDGMASPFRLDTVTDGIPMRSEMGR